MAIPFCFEKVKCTEASYLMLSESEIQLLLASELPDIIESLDRTDEHLDSVLNSLYEKAEGLSPQRKVEG